MIYKVKENSSHDTEGYEDNDSFFRISVNSIEYLGESSIALYIEDVTEHERNKILSNELLKQRSEQRNMENFTSTISHEFRTPLATALTFIVLLLSLITDA